MRKMPRVSLGPSSQTERVEDPGDPDSLGFHLVSPHGCSEVWECPGFEDERLIVQYRDSWSVMSGLEAHEDGFSNREACVRHVLSTTRARRFPFESGTRVLLHQVRAVRREAVTWLPLRFVDNDGARWSDFVPDNEKDSVFLRERGSRPGELDLYRALALVHGNVVDQIDVLFYAAVWTAFGPDTSNPERRDLWTRFTRPFPHHNRTKNLLPFDMEEDLLPSADQCTSVVLAVAIGAAVRLAYAHLLRGRIVGSLHGGH